MEKYMLKLILLGILVHITLFIGVTEIYFQSSIQHGLPHYESLSKPPAKRVVLIIADGLRAESLYAKMSENRTPFLTKTRYERASWGTSHTRVPTESRPGHVSIMAGIYEDPSAIFKGWQQNPVEFDSVINQSANAWCLGSPDNVYLFNKGNSPHIRTHSYSSEIQDFGKKQTYYLDEWVFKEIHKLFQYRNKDVDCKALCENKNIFFLNLLGLDTAGHSYKPNSKEHIYNMRVVDNGVRDLEILFETFFNDRQTAYIFTADHGMTDWGSHGDGSTYETETPFIAWGAGIKPDRASKDINQADIAPLIASLIGINYPANSIGVLPYKHLHISDENIAEALISNIKQLLELYKNEEKKSATVYFYKPHEDLLHIRSLLYELDGYLKKHKYEDLINRCNELINSILDGLNYQQSYSSRPIFICLSFTMVYWLIYLINSILYDERIEIRDEYIYRPENNNKLYIKSSLFIITFVSCYIFFRSPMEWTNYFYLALPILILSMIFKNVEGLISLKKTFFRCFKINLIYTLISFTLLEIFVAGFHYRYIFSFFMFAICLWPVGMNWYYEYEIKNKLLWTANCLIVAIFPILPVMHTDFNYYWFLFTVAIWFYTLLSKFKIQDIALGNIDNRIIYGFVFRNQFVCYIVTAFNSLYIAICFAQETEVPPCCHWISWILLVVSIFNIYISPIYIQFRLSTITMSLMNIYTLLLFNFEGAFFICFFYLLCHWMQIEVYIQRGRRASDVMKLLKFNDHHLGRPNGKYSYDAFRRALFYLGFIFISFFGTGNIASLNSFDPMWVRNFLTVFSPFKMMALILLKTTIPMLLVTCFFRAINLLSNIHTKNMYSIVFLFCDVMLFHFMFLIKNTGSWLEIGTSLSHFIIMELISVILMFFYFMSNIITNFTIHRQYIRYIERCDF